LKKRIFILFENITIAPVDEKLYVCAVRLVAIFRHVDPFIFFVNVLPISMGSDTIEIFCNPDGTNKNLKSILMGG